MFIKKINDSRKKKSIIFFSNLAKKNNINACVGRPTNRKINNNAIFADIINKLNVKKKDKILTVGTGCGKLVDLWIKKSLQFNLNLYILDFPDVISKIKKKYSSNLLQKKFFKLIPGTFPEIIDNSKIDSLKSIKFNCIELYSVIHYSDNFFKMINAAVNLLDNNGRLLIGDIPNLSTQGRFLSTSFGINFHNNYKNVNLKKVNNIQNFIKKKIKDGETNIDDKCILKILTTYRKRGYNTYLLNQNKNLPFHFTREDILITKNFYDS
jgi:ubiquinone/menaquinone biosynthesis C-methylase UbiE